MSAEMLPGWLFFFACSTIFFFNTISWKKILWTFYNPHLLSSFSFGSMRSTRLSHVDESVGEWRGMLARGKNFKHRIICPIYIHVGTREKLFFSPGWTIMNAVSFCDVVLLVFLEYHTRHIRRKFESCHVMCERGHLKTMEFFLDKRCWRWETGGKGKDG